MKEFLLLVVAKLLLIPAYRSTDYQVHRNWIAITNSLPISQWYFDETSHHTLDYPPFFAWFQYLLSFGCFIDPKMCIVQKEDYYSFISLVYMRCTVIFSDLLFYLALKIYFKSRFHITYFFIPALFMVDNIHFQYNGILFAIFILSIYFAENEQYYLSGTIFTILIHFKHLFIYMAPAYMIYFLVQKKLPNYKVVPIIILISFISLYPFDIKQVISRLFPFKRGLTHSYWAPNIWSLYNTLEIIYSKSKFLTSGQVGVYEYQLFNITPIMTNIICMSSFIFVYLFRKDLVHAVIHSCFIFFLFGYHVHEKAILMMIIPMSLKPEWNRLYYLMNIVGAFSVFPLLFRPQEFLIKWGILITFMINYPQITLKKLDSLFIYGIFLLQFIIFFIPTKLEYLPLILISNYSSICVLYLWIESLFLSFHFLKKTNIE